MNGTDKIGAVPSLLSSPAWLCVSGLFVTLGAYLIDFTVGVSPWRASAPIEIGSNLVAAIGLAWALVQLRNNRGAGWPRRAWILAATGMAIFCFDDNASGVLARADQRASDMAISIGLWTVAAIFLWAGLRRYAFQSYVMEFVKLGMALQIAAQAVGWLAVTGSGPDQHADQLKVVNDVAELIAVLAYIAALLLAEFAPRKRHSFAFTFERCDGTSGHRRSTASAHGGAIDLDGYRRNRNLGRSRPARSGQDPREGFR